MSRKKVLICTWISVGYMFLSNLGSMLQLGGDFLTSAGYVAGVLLIPIICAIILTLDKNDNNVRKPISKDHIKKLIKWSITAIVIIGLLIGLYFILLYLELLP